MARKEGKGEHLAMKERVVATTDMPGIPEGTTGKVIVVEGSLDPLLGPVRQRRRTGLAQPQGPRPAE